MILNATNQCLQNLMSSSGDPKFYKQRTAEWFNAKKGKIDGRKVATALGWYGKKGHD